MIKIVFVKSLRLWLVCSTLLTPSLVGVVKNLLKRLEIFRHREKEFGRQLALTSVKTTRPDEWWRIFGHDCPNLKKLAIKLLSQAASSSGCEWNWSVFERIHTKKRNRLEHDKMNDLVYVYYNL